MSELMLNWSGPEGRPESRGGISARDHGHDDYPPEVNDTAHTFANGWRLAEYDYG